MYTKHKGHATTLTKKAIKQQVNIIIGVGGDGTINEIINGMSKTTIPLGIIPSGTANVLSLETCGPSSLKKLSRSIIDKKQNTLYLLKANTTFFSSFCGVGIDAQIIKTADTYLKPILGALSYVIAAFWVLLIKKQKSFHIRLDEKKEISTKWAVFLNTKYYAGPYLLSPSSTLYKKEKKMVIIQGLHWKECLKIIYKPKKIELYKILKTKKYSYKKAQISTPNIPIHLDGNYYKKTPVTIIQDSSINILTS